MQGQQRTQLTLGRWDSQLDCPKLRQNGQAFEPLHGMLAAHGEGPNLNEAALVSGGGFPGGVWGDPWAVLST